ncbi:MAG: TlpA disulfide reductase family protein [Pseudomonadota bacterium]
MAGTLLCLALAATAQPFVFKDMQGKQQRLQDYRGKWVLVNFWATWCPPCLEEVPDLVSLHEAHKKTDLVVIGVALDSSEKSVREFIDKRHVSYPIVLGDYELAAQVGEVEVLPTTYMYNPQGELVSYQQGIVTRGSVESYMKNNK